MSDEITAEAIAASERAKERNRTRDGKFADEHKNYDLLNVPQVETGVDKALRAADIADIVRTHVSDSTDWVDDELSDTTLMKVVPAAALHEIQAKVANFNKRMSDKGMTGRVTLEIQKQIQRRDDLGVIHNEASVYINRSGLFSLGEYKFRGMYDFSASDQPLRFSFDDNYEHAREVDPLQCDHCGVQRQRHRVFVVTDHAGSDYLIGSSCLKDYTGHSPNSVLWLKEQCKNLDNDLDSAVRSPTRVDTQEYLAAAVAATRHYGFVKSQSTDHRAQPTKETAIDLLYSTQPATVGVTDKDRVEAEEIIEWAKTMRTKNDFEDNMQIVAHAESVGSKAWGVAAYLPTAYKRYREKEFAKRSVAQGSEAPTGRVTVIGKILNVDARHNYYTGQLEYKVKISADEGYQLWGTLPQKAWETTAEGDLVSFVATITPSGDNPSFGFYKRPTKWEVLKPADGEPN